MVTLSFVELPFPSLKQLLTELSKCKSHQIHILSRALNCLFASYLIHSSQKVYSSLLSLLLFLMKDRERD